MSDLVRIPIVGFLMSRLNYVNSNLNGVRAHTVPYKGSKPSGFEYQNIDMARGLCSLNKLIKPAIIRFFYPQETPCKIERFYNEGFVGKDIRRTLAQHNVLVKAS